MRSRADDGCYAGVMADGVDGSLSDEEMQEKMMRSVTRTEGRTCVRASLRVANDLTDLVYHCTVQ